MACYLSIYSIEGLDYFIYLVNGKLRTPKAYQINLVIDWLNQNRGTLFNIKKLPICSKMLWGDAWLAGFIDADGSFAIRQTLPIKTTKKQTECEFILVQRIVYPKTGSSYAHIFGQIACFLCVKSNILKARNPNAQDQLKIKVGSVKSKAILRIYLNKYPLLSSKRLDYLAWSSADDRMLQKLHYTPQGVKEITKIKKSMNRLRTVLNWGHLNQL